MRTEFSKASKRLGCRAPVWFVRLRFQRRPRSPEGRTGPFDHIHRVRWQRSQRARRGGFTQCLAPCPRWKTADALSIGWKAFRDLDGIRLLGDSGQLHLPGRIGRRIETGNKRRACLGGQCHGHEHPAEQTGSAQQGHQCIQTSSRQPAGKRRLCPPVLVNERVRSRADCDRRADARGFCGVAKGSADPAGPRTVPRVSLRKVPCRARGRRRDS